MKTTKLGLFNAALEVDEIGCKMLEQNDFPIDCTNKSSPIKIDKLEILWRTPEYIIRYIGKDQKSHRLTIRADHVHGNANTEEELSSGSK